MSSPGWSARCSSNDGAGPAAAPPMTPSSPPLPLPCRSIKRARRRSRQRVRRGGRGRSWGRAPEAGSTMRPSPSCGDGSAMRAPARPMHLPRTSSRRSTRCSTRSASRRPTRPAGGDGGFIKANLSDLVLGLDDLRAAFHCSRSSGYRCFEQHGGVASYIREQCLHRCFDELAQPTELPRRIADVAT